MIKKYFFKNCITLLLCLILALPCHAAKEGSIAVRLEDSQKLPVNGLSVSLCKLASIKENTFLWEQSFEEAGFSLDHLLTALNETNAKTLKEYIEKRNVPHSKITAQEGLARFEGLDFGLYLIFCEDNQSHYFNPHFITLPYRQGGSLQSHAVTMPKLRQNTGRDKSIYLIKKWEDRNNAAGKRPSSIHITLLRDGKEIQSATISQHTAWSYTFKNLPNDGKYTIEENPVTNYTPSYNGDADNGFTITNTYSEKKLPQTGQFWWPFILLLIASAAFIILGILELKGKKTNGKKG